MLDYISTYKLSCHGSWGTSLPRASRIGLAAAAVSLDPQHCLLLLSRAAASVAGGLWIAHQCGWQCDVREAPRPRKSGLSQGLQPDLPAHLLEALLPGKPCTVHMKCPFLRLPCLNRPPPGCLPGTACHNNSCVQQHHTLLHRDTEHTRNKTAHTKEATCSLQQFRRHTWQAACWLQ